MLANWLSFRGPFLHIYIHIPYTILWLTSPSPQLSSLYTWFISPNCGSHEVPLISPCCFSVHVVRWRLMEPSAPLLRDFRPVRPCGLRSRVSSKGLSVEARWRTLALLQGTCLLTILLKSLKSKKRRKDQRFVAKKTAVLQETGGRVVWGPLWLSDQEHFQSLCRKAEQEWCTCFLKGWTLIITYIDIHPCYTSSLNPWNSAASVGTSWLLEALTAAMSTPKLDGDDGEARDEATKRHVAHPAFTIGIMWVIWIIWDNMDLSSK
jgi:hypothetical protein